MALAEIRGGAHIDVLNAAELAAELDLRLGPEKRREWWAEQQIAEQHAELTKYRSIKYLRRDSQLQSPATSRLTILDSILAEAGQAWIIRLLSAQLSSAGTFQAFITSDTDTTKTGASQRRLVASGASNQYQVFTYNTGACVLQPDEGLLLTGGQTILSYMITGWQVPMEMVAKLA